MALLRRCPGTSNFVQSVQQTFFLSKLLGLASFTFEKNDQKFEQSSFLSKYGNLMRTLWAWTAIPMYFIFWVETCSLDAKKGDEQTKHSGTQRSLLYMVNGAQLWLGITVLLTHHAFNNCLQVRLLNALVRCNRKLMKLIKRLPNKRFRTFNTIRVIVTVMDIFLIYDRPKEIVMFSIDWESLVVCHRLVTMASFLEWHFIQTHLTESMDALKELLDTDGPDFDARHYDSLSKIYTQLFHLHQATCTYYQPFVLVTCVSLFRTVIMAFQMLQSLFFTSLKSQMLPSVACAFKLFMIPGVTCVLDFLMICSMTDFFLTSTNLYRWAFLLRSLRSEPDNPTQRTIETILRQSCWEPLNWALVTGHTISRETAALLIDGVISLTLAFLVYDAGYTYAGNVLKFAVYSPHRYQYYLTCMVFGIGCVTCHKIIAWCDPNRV